MWGVCYQAAAWAASKDPRGEYTVVLEGASLSNTDDNDADMADAVHTVRTLIASGVKTSDAVKQAANATGVVRTDLYEAVLKLKS